MASILIINPNSTASMTEKAAIAARRVSAPGTTIVARTSKSGPASIQGRADGEAALPGLFAEIEAAKQDSFDAIVIACFDDTGLYEARKLTDIPVIGIGEAAFHTAMMVGSRFTVVTTLTVSVAVIEDNLRLYGLSRRCARVRASEVPVLDLEIPGSAARQRISAEIGMAVAEGEADAIVLGCAGMADLADALSREHGLPVIDGVAAAVKMAEALAALGLRTSQAGPFRLAS
ncbi:MAG: aspartate/glutamate racemase family protein [Rhizobiaceae bacterium]|jgi:allantoin racemase